MTNLDPDIDETARLILMDEPDVRLYGLGVRLREELGRSVTVTELGVIWRRYRGFDSRTQPTHEVTTGERRYNR